jgi:hypothetical protein
MQDWFYQHSERGLCLTFKAMIDCGVPENTLFSASLRKSKAWAMIDHPEDKRKRLIVWNELASAHQAKVHTKLRKITGCKHDDSEHCACGDPANYIAKEPIRKLVQKDFKAEEFYRSKLIEMKVANVNDYVFKYTTAASWLNMLIKLNADKKFIKKQLNLSLEDFFSHVCDIIKTDNIDLPSSYQRLRTKMAEYQDKGYECLIDWRFGNKLSAKIGKSEDGFDAELAQKQIAVIRKAATAHNNFDAMQITMAVNRLFELNGWEKVSHGTVYNIIQANTHLTTPGNRGKRAYNNEFAMQVKRERPKFPLAYLTMDGWTVELLYREGSTYNNRLCLVVVLDPVNNYPLGYAIGDRENTELIRQANRNAIVHTQELFGQAYRPWQLQSDRYGLKTLTPFFQAVAHVHTPAAVGNAKAKVIEPYFSYINNKYCQRHFNWSGHNVTASKSNQVNAEFLDKIKTSFPDKAGVIKQIELMMAQERKLKVEEYLQKWELAPESEKVLFTRMDRLMTFGRPTGYTNSVTGQGITMSIEGQKLTYDSFNPQFRALQHMKFQMIYDQDDLTSVLALSEDGKHRFVLDQKRAIPMDLRSMTDEDYGYLSKVREFNKTREQEIVQTYIEDAAIVEEVISNTPLALDDYNEATLKLMFTYSGQQKEKLQDAKGLARVERKEQKRIEVEQKQEVDNWQAIQQQYLESKTDFNKYLD